MLQSSLQHKPIHIEPLNIEINNNDESKGDVINIGRFGAISNSATNTVTLITVSHKVIVFIVFIFIVIYFVIVSFSCATIPTICIIAIPKNIDVNVGLR